LKRCASAKSLTMNKKIILITVAAIILLVPVFLMTGCPRHNDSLYGARVAGDGNGGALVVYEAMVSGTRSRGLRYRLSSTVRWMKGA